MFTVPQPLENRVCGDEWPEHASRSLPRCAGSRIVLGWNRLGLSTVGLKTMLGLFPGASVQPLCCRCWLWGQVLDFKGLNPYSSVSRAEQGALVGYSEVTHLPAPGLSVRGSLCSWKSFCGVDHGVAGNQAALPTGVRRG